MLQAEHLIFQHPGNPRRYDLSFVARPGEITAIIGVIALFGTQDFTTLPLLMYRALGAYRTNDAATIAALMLVITIAAFVLLPRLVGKLTDASS